MRYFTALRAADYYHEHHELKSHERKFESQSMALEFQKICNLFMKFVERKNVS
jgi:hypothetical protein